MVVGELRLRHVSPSFCHRPLASGLRPHTQAVRDKSNASSSATYCCVQIPRPSKHEGRVLTYLKQFADTRSLAWQQDAVGNLVIRRPGQ